ncbi:MAG: hypothetical protein ABJ242_12585 [Marinomonas sp.]
MTMRASSSSIAIIASLVSAPAIAQSANDFQLPPAPAPTNTPAVEGPVDDSGIIPVGPRTTPAPTPTPSPAPAATLPSVLTPTPTPTGSPSSGAPSPPRATSQPVVQPTGSSARPATGRSPAAPTSSRTPNTQRTPQPLPERTLVPLEESDAAPNEAGAIPAAPDSEAATNAPSGAASAPTAEAADTATDTASSSAMPDWLLWVLGAAAALLALFLGYGWWRRRADAAPAELMAAPIKPATEGPEEEATETAETIAQSDTAPVAAPVTAPIAAAQPELNLKLEIEKLSRSMMMITLKCRVTLANRADKAARDVTVSADLVSANRGLPMDAQVATPTAFLPEIGEAQRIGPHKTQSFPATITLPVQQLAAFNHGNKPMFVPLVRVRMDTKDAEPEFHTFVVGIAADPTLTASTKLHPVPLDGIPGGYENVRSRRIDNPA